MMGLRGNVATLPTPLKVQKPRREGGRGFALWWHPDEVVRLPPKRHARLWRCGLQLRKTVAMCGHLSNCPIQPVLPWKEAWRGCVRGFACSNHFWPPSVAILFLQGTRPPPKHGYGPRCPRASKPDRMPCFRRRQMAPKRSKDRCVCATGIRLLAFPKAHGCLVGQSVDHRNCQRCARAHGHRQGNVRGRQPHGSPCPIRKEWSRSVPWSLPAFGTTIQVAMEGRHSSWGMT